MPQKYKVKTQRSSEAITFNETKKFLKVDTDYDDSVISMMITAAHDHFERMTNWYIIETVFEVYQSQMDRFELLKGNFLGLASVEYLKDGSLVTFDNSNYENLHDNAFGLFQAYPPNTIPVTDDIDYPVKITFSVGYGSQPEDVPAQVKLILLQLTSFLYENRGDCSDEKMSESLLNQILQYKVMRLG